MDVGGGEGGARQDGCREGARTEECDIAKVQQAGEADRYIEAHRGCGEDDHLRGDGHVRIRSPLGEGEQEGDDECGEDQHLPVALRCTGEKSHDANSEQHRDECAKESYETDERATIVDVQRESGGEECSPHHYSDEKDLKS